MLYLDHFLAIFADFDFADCLHLASDQVSGDSFHLQAKASRVKFQAVVAYDRGQDHLRSVLATVQY